MSTYLFKIEYADGMNFWRDRHLKLLLRDGNNIRGVKEDLEKELDEKVDSGSYVEYCITDIRKIDE